jgi:transposase
MERLRPYLDTASWNWTTTPPNAACAPSPSGRKNYLFVGSEAGGKAAAIAYTLIETAKLNAVDPHAWLADTLARPITNPVTVRPGRVLRRG